jgi:organic hydroperoxide reductase OsmC/OhrA
MPETTVYRATLTLAQGFEFVARFDHLAEPVEVRLDEPPPLGAGRGPNAAALVAAAAANCLAASLLFCLQKSRVAVATLSARVAAHVARNEAGRLRLSRLEVELEPGVAPEELAKLERCTQLFEDFCVVTQSLRRGVPVAVTVRPAGGSAGAPA